MIRTDKKRDQTQRQYRNSSLHDFARGRAALLFAAVLSTALGGGRVNADPVFALTQPSIAVTNITKVMFDAVTLVGTRLFVVGEHGVIAYSDDNGATWSQAKVPVDVTLTAISFVDSQSGWAVGNSGVVLHTQDGGRNWNLQLDGNGVNQLTMTAALQAEQAADKSVEDFNALHRAQIFAAAGPDKPFLCLMPLSKTKILALGAYRMAVMTDDVGKSWSDWSLHILDPVSHHLYDAERIRDSIDVVGEAGLIFQSKDEGQSFQPLPSPTQATLFGLLSTGNGALLVYGVAGQVFFSPDAGLTWQPVTLQSMSNFTSAILLKTGDVLLANEAGRLFTSSDHGRTFREQSFGFQMAVFAIEQAENGDIVAVGSSGIMRTSVSILDLN